MLLIVLINGLISMVTGGLIYKNIHEFKMSKKRMIIYFIFASFFMFSGFLRVKVAFTEDFGKFDLFNQYTMFATLSCISNGICMAVAYDLIKIEKKC